MNGAAQESRPLRPFSFATKAGTLENLRGRLANARLCDQETITKSAWLAESDGVLERIRARFEGCSLAVRSSARHEDGDESSMAGAHLSLTSVSCEADELADAISQVFASYENPEDEDEVLIQPMVKDVVISGVVLTRDLDTGSPYYVVNYDDFSGRTDTVTGGAESKCIMVRRSKRASLRSERFNNLLRAVVELETVTGSSEIDIEFCINEANDVYILQVRPLAARHRWDAVDDAHVEAAIDKIHRQVDAGQRAPAGIFGKRTVYAEMPDWNPAEMIGTTPRPLALSLYKTLITDRAWADARAAMGYRHVDRNLMIDFAGRPFIDVRLSFNSFLPAGIGERAGQILVNHHIRKLSENPQLHDKIEFDIAVTCRDFGAPDRLAELGAAGVPDDVLAELDAGLADVTGEALAQRMGRMPQLLKRAETLLEDDLEPFRSGDLSNLGAWIDECRADGTLPFAELARHGFIGVLFLRSLVERGVFTNDEANRVIQGTRTVATEFVEAMNAVVARSMDETRFLRRFGHLRPGTYDILSWRYDEKSELYLGHDGQAAPSPSVVHEPFEPSGEALASIGRLLDEFGYPLGPDDLLGYISAAIAAREMAKFCFTRRLSNVLMALTHWGAAHGFSRDDLSFLDIGDLVQGRSETECRERIVEARARYQLTRAIRLPHIIADTSRIDVVGLPLGQPTFITSKSVTGPSCLVTSNSAPDIDDKIVFIESADPGYDWIFSHRIKGLVTKFGGANSHMAIRCAEFGLPAAIGCGERLFEQLLSARLVHLNCANRRVSDH